MISEDSLNEPYTRCEEIGSVSNSLSTRKLVSFQAHPRTAASVGATVPSCDKKGGGVKNPLKPSQRGDTGFSQRTLEQHYIRLKDGAMIQLSHLVGGKSASSGGRLLAHSSWGQKQANGGEDDARGKRHAQTEQLHPRGGASLDGHLSYEGTIALGATDKKVTAKGVWKRSDRANAA